DRRPVEGLRHHQVTDEACGVEERAEEDGVRDDAVDERDDPSHDLSPRQVVIQPCASATDDGSCAAVAVLVPPTYPDNPHSPASGGATFRVATGYPRGSRHMGMS